ncbi:MAG TPA: CapA family protein [Patescibacteria group bacterium]|nr:CapA family protein [Patescibacteria group bacterium]
MSAFFWRALRASGIGIVLGFAFFGTMIRYQILVPRVYGFFQANPFSVTSVSNVFAWGRDGFTIDPSPIRVLFVGDLMLDRNVRARTALSKNPLYPFAHLPEHWFSSFDYAVANLEGPVTEERRPPEKTIDFQFDPSVVGILKSVGIRAVSQANNHTYDQGLIGFSDSRTRLQGGGLLVFGDQIHDDDRALTTSTIRGERFAFLGFNVTDRALDQTQAAQEIKKARAEADCVIVMMHWGQEYRDRPEPQTRLLAHWLIDQGADAVIGGHPHWVQGIESYHHHPILYSLGNFVFDQDFSIPTKQGLAVELDFSAKQIVLQLIPIQIDLSQPRVLDGKEKEIRLESLAAISDQNLAEQIKSGTVVFSP